MSRIGVCLTTKKGRLLWRACGSWRLVTACALLLCLSFNSWVLHPCSFRFIYLELVCRILCSGEREGRLYVPTRVHLNVGCRNCLLQNVILGLDSSCYWRENVQRFCFTYYVCTGSPCGIGHARDNLLMQTTWYALPAD